MTANARISRDSRRLLQDVLEMQNFQNKLGGQVCDAYRKKRAKFLQCFAH